MDGEAREYFFSWWNRKVERINRIEDDAEVDSREMKHPAHVARLALIIQVLRHASGESHLQFIDVSSVKAAIRLNDYLRNHTRVSVLSWRMTPVKTLPRCCCLCCLIPLIQNSNNHWKGTAVRQRADCHELPERVMPQQASPEIKSRTLREIMYDKSGKSNENNNESSPRNCNG